MKSSDLLKRLPSVNELLANPRVKSVVDRLNPGVVASRVRGYLDELRDELGSRADDLPLPSVREVIDRVARYVARDEGWSLVGVVNATGRLRGGPWAAGPLADAAAERVLLLSKDYVGERGPRLGVADDATRQLARLAGAEAAAVFHSRAGALSLVVAELAGRPPLVVARGELGEVDPGCRLTDLCNSVGARMHEVGSIDGAAVADYAAGLPSAPAAVLRLAPESYRLLGGSPRVSTGELAAATRSLKATLVEDLGGAPLTPLPDLKGLAAQSASEAIAAGADVVLLRGDGLIGGPPCGIVLGRREFIERLHGRSLAPAHRPTAATVAALATCVKALESPSRAVLDNPLLSLLATPIENLKNRAERLAPQIAACPLVSGVRCVEVAAESAAISGLPYAAPTVLLGVTPVDGNAGRLAEALAASTPPIWGVVQGDALLLDLRSVFPRQDIAIVSAFPREADETPTDPAVAT